MAEWPFSLPQKPLLEGYEEREPNTLIRTEMDAGPVKTRRRFTAGVRLIRVAFHLTESQKTTLSTFYRSTLQDGALRYDWTPPGFASVVECRITEPPVYRALRPDLWRAEFPVEVLP
jgi:hypothetical protein